MRLHFFILCTLISIISTETYATELKGKIIRTNDTLSVTFSISLNRISGEPNYFTLQRRISYYDKNGKKLKVKPDDVLEVQFTFEGRTIRMLSIPKALIPVIQTRDYLFLKLEREFDQGKLKHFYYYYKQTHGSSIENIPTTTYSIKRREFLQTNNDRLIDIRKRKAKKILKRYFENKRS